MELDPEVADVLRAALADAEDMDDLRRRIEASEIAEKETRLAPFVFAFGYTLLEKGGERRENVGEPFGAMMAGDGWRFPPPVADVSDEVLGAWAAAYDAFDDPLVRARLGDLLWERRFPPAPHEKARAAADALVELSRGDAHVMKRAKGLSRALELVRSVSDGTRQVAVVEALTDLIRSDLASEDGGPGASLLPMRTLMSLPAAERPESLGDLLSQIDERYGSDPFIADEVADLQARLVDDAGEREALRLAQVKRGRDGASEGETTLRGIRLERALELASSYGFVDEANDIRSELSGIAPDELEMQTISTEIQMPDGEVERFLALFKEAESWEDALLRLASQPPPGGKPEELSVRVDAQMGEFPVQFLFPQVVVGPDNASAIFKADTPERHKRLQLAVERAREGKLWSIFAADAFDAVSATFARPDREALTEFFTGEMVGSEVAERMAKALELHWDGDFDEAAHLLVPRLERVIRELARRIGVPVMREPQGEKLGGVGTFGLLLRDLEGAFGDPAWHAYLVNLLVDPLGLNLRNVICHGLAERIGRGDSALLLQVAIVLSQMRLTATPDPPEPPPGAAPA